MTALSIVFGFRDRDTTRVQRCLDSLVKQTFTDFEVLFVDYGSKAHTAQAIQSVVESYPFARYIYTETRGYPWNRSHALNIGGKLASGTYLMTTDVDVIFASDFLSVIMQHTAEKREVHILPYMLPQKFDDWHNVTDYTGKFPKGPENMLGVCQVIATRVFHEMRGYDEYYRYYGLEDRDMSRRLTLLGVEEYWLTDETTLFHQWHPPANYSVTSIVPEGVWGRLEVYYLRNQHEAIRNPDGWGFIHTPENRPVLRFVDADNQRLNDCPELHHFDFRLTAPQAVGQLSQQFRDLESGHALAIDHAAFPHHTPASDFVRNWTNRLLYRINPNTRLEYPTNRLHNFVANLVEPPAPYVADYYLNLPIMNGVSVIVKQ